VGLILRAERSEGRQGMSLAAFAAHVERALMEAQRTGVDPDTIEPHVSITPRGKIKRLEIEIP
jgi:hypothetical protein